jgi:hypothetical protein
MEKSRAALEAKACELIHLETNHFLNVALKMMDERQIASGIAAPQCGNYDDKTSSPTGVRRFRDGSQVWHGVLYQRSCLFYRENTFKPRNTRNTRNK